ncbi:JAB domain-containing protein [Pleomorphochaeta sp. DL1XJH-081]|uniref:JAB domain-containing protein n=1 Tax=Pleomorphochaeta sp. DL1XJH-081 TaxID=3409690 RepID=UPI003BB6D43C
MKYLFHPHWRREGGIWQSSQRAINSSHLSAPPPSGILHPSTDYMRVTQRLIQAGELLGIRVLDHLIFSDESYRSLLEENELS